MNLLDELLLVLEALELAELPYALCGGIAVGFYGYPRFTKDIDLLIREEEIDRAKEVLGAIGFDLPAGPIPFATGTPQARILHRVSKAGGPDLITLDLMVVTPVFEEIFRDRELIDWQGRELQIVSVAGLARMKRLAGRGQDLVDLEHLGFDEAEGEEGE